MIHKNKQIIKKKKNFVLRISHYKCYLCLLSIVWSKNLLLNYIEQFISKVPIIGNFSEILIFVICIICILGAIPYIKKYIRWVDVLFYIVVVLIYIASLLYNSEYLLPKLTNLMGISVPLYFLGLSVNAKLEIKLMYIISLLTIWCRIMYMLLFEDAMSLTVSTFDGNMDAAYKILPYVCLVVAMVIKKPDIWGIITAFIGVIFLFSCGTRGALVCILIFTVFYVLLFRKYDRPLVAYPLIGLISVTVYVFLDKIIYWLSDIALHIGMSNRIFLRIIGNKFWESNSRNILYEQIIDAILKKPIWGYGVGGDFIIADIYVHNIILELLVSYGIILGAILLAAILYISCKGILKTRYEEEKVFALILVCSILIKLFLSGTYLDEVYFFFMLGVCIGNNRRFNKN